MLCDEAVGGDERCAELLETLPDLDALFERKSTEEVQATLAQHINDPSNSSETERYGGASTANNQEQVSAVDAAFRELL